MVMLSLGDRRESDALPLYMQRDTIANKNAAIIDLDISSDYRSDSMQIEILKTDYLNIWSHLNHLFATNDIVAGKAYYTEDWFKRLEKNYSEKMNLDIERHDVEHKLNILHLSTDDLVCTTSDTVTFITRYGKQHLNETYIVYMALLYQGDHWRIDAAHFNQIEQ